MATLPTRAAVAAALVVLASARPAAADRKVYLNGVDLTDTAVSDQRFESCKVVFDEAGNVHITAPGFEIRRRTIGTQTGARAAPARPAQEMASTEEPDIGKLAAADPRAGKVKLRYFLVSRQARRGLAQYDVSVYLNGQLIKVVRSDRDPVIMEITRLVRPGENTVKLVAVKNLGPADRRSSFSAVDHMEVIIGEGAVSDGTVIIKNPLIEYRRNAAETRRYTDSLLLTGK
jgi:hypothetical protein